MSDSTPGLPWLPGNSGRPAPGSLIARWFARGRRHPDAFTAGLQIEGRWRFRPSAVDPLVVDGVVALQWGERPIRLRPSSVDGSGPRPGHVLVSGTAESGEPVTLSVPLDDVARFGLEA